MIKLVPIIARVHMGMEATNVRLVSTVALISVYFNQGKRIFKFVIYSLLDNGESLRGQTLLTRPWKCYSIWY